MSAEAEAAPAPGQTTTTITATTHLTLPAHQTPLTYDQLNPKSHAKEFLGPLGTAFISLSVPITTYVLFFACNEVTGCTPTTADGWRHMINSWGAWPTPKGHFWDWGAAAVYLGWYGFCVLCWRVLPGEKVEGTLLRDGTKRVYKINGLHTFVLSLGITLGILLQPQGPQAFTYLYDHWVPLVSAAVVMATAQATWVYAWSFYSKELLALGGNSGVFIYDWFLGRPLNPTYPKLPSFDIKTFNELRPGIILWTLLNISCACEQYSRWGKVTDSMWLVLAFEGWYAADSMWYEHTILHQMDITTDGFGFMLSAGDLVWLPFTYGIQARYLAFHPVELGPIWCAVILAVQAVGVWMFRASNNEKAAFRADLTFIETERGTKLLTSGWWGMSRHPNYLGDWLNALAWCLPTGFGTPITYFYLAYFVVLLLHRQMRDDEACKEKYGKDWDRYCKLVPWKIIPGVY